jgi:integrase
MTGNRHPYYQSSGLIVSNRKWLGSPFKVPPRRGTLLQAPGSGHDGSVWPPSAFTSAYRDLLRRREIANVRFHDLRHSHVSQLLRSGVSPKVISERLGRSKAGFTLDVYSQSVAGYAGGSRIEGGYRAARCTGQATPPLSLNPARTVFSD